MSARAIVLASGSLSRRVMLEAAGVVFTTVVPNVDEEKMRDLLLAGNADAKTIACALAEAKALAVSERHEGALVIGADQMLVCEGRLYNKALDEDGARATLAALRGRTHTLISAAVISRDEDIVWRKVENVEMKMRDFSDEFLRDYLAAELPDILGSVGCYRIEGRGAQLFEPPIGDHFCIRGLPLLALLDALRAQDGLLA